MWKFAFTSTILSLITTLLTGATAIACSCGTCTYDMNVSAAVQDSNIFWGIPTESRYVKGAGTADQWIQDLVVNKVQVLEGYGRLQDGSELTITSSPDDGGSCGVQLNVGVPQLIYANADNDIGSCNCIPPGAYLLEYLKNGKDHYIPSFDDCVDPTMGEFGGFRTTKECKVWSESFKNENAFREERKRVYKILREKDEPKAEE